MIYNNMNKLLSIIDIIYPKYKDDEDLEYAIESFKEYDIGILSNKKNAIENVKRKFIFDMLGLQDFINNDLDNYLLTKDDIKDEGIKIMEDYFGEKEFTRILKK